MTTTRFISKHQMAPHGDIERNWLYVDAAGKTLGRLSTTVAKVLQGKHKPIYTPHTDTGDYVIIVNADKIKLTGNKLMNKIYYHHTGYPGGLKEATAQALLEKKPTSLIYKAVKGMMPKNQLNRDSLRKLKIYVGPNHPHKGINPQPLEV